MFDPSNERPKNDTTPLPELNRIADFQRQCVWQCFVRFVCYNHNSSSCDLE